MKKTRYIPYGYTIRNGRIVVENDEATIVREIYACYVNGFSLKDIANDLTTRKVPYTEKTAVWDKARIARILENAKYVGDGEYDPIIEEQTYEHALASKTARQRGEYRSDCSAIGFLRTRVRCEVCGTPMARHLCSKLKIKESWTCQNPTCGCRVRISDRQFVEKVVLQMNRIIENTELLIPQPKEKHTDSPKVTALQNDILQELEKAVPSEDRIIEKIADLSATLYRENNAREMIAIRIARKRAAMMHPTEQFNETNFQDLVSYITLGQNGQVTLHTKTDTEVGKEEDYGNHENPETNGHGD